MTYQYMRSPYLITCFIIIFALLVDAKREKKEKVDMYPVNVNGVIGESWVETCSVTSQRFNASNLMFSISMPNKKVVSINRSFIHIVNSSTVELRYPELNSTHSGATLKCYVDKDSSVNYKSNMLVGSRPCKPYIHMYFVNNWDKLVFTWSSDKVDKVFNNVYTMWYRNSKLEEFVRCPEYKETDRECRVNVKELLSMEQPNVTFVVKVNVTNPVGRNSSDDVSVDLNKCVIPGEVTNITVLFTDDSDKIDIRFKPPKLQKTLLYNISVTCSENNSTNVTLNFLSLQNGSDLVKIPVSGLPSYHTCRVAVSVKGSVAWGRSAYSGHFQTKQNVPLVSPKTCQSCFELQRRATPGSVDIVVYFKELSRSEACGVVTDYRVRYTCGENSGEQHFPAGNDITSISVTVNDSSSFCHVQLDAGTHVGYNNSLQPMSILVPLKGDAVQAKNFTVLIINNTYVQFSWQCAENVQQYTVFWYYAGLDHKGVLNWKEMQSNESRYEIQLPVNEPSDNYKFGIAMKMVDTNWKSGILWTDCVYTYDGIPEAPKITIIEAASSIAHLRVDTLLCRKGSGFIHELQLNNCLANDVHHCQERRIAPVQTEILLSDLLPDQRYIVSARGISSGGRISTLSVPAEFVTKKAVVSSDSRVLEFVLIPCAVVSSIVIITVVCKLTSSKLRQKLLHQPICVPNSYVNQCATEHDAPRLAPPATAPEYELLPSCVPKSDSTPNSSVEDAVDDSQQLNPNYAVARQHGWPFDDSDRWHYTDPQPICPDYGSGGIAQCNVKQSEQSSVQNDEPVLDIEHLRSTDPQPIFPDYGSGGNSARCYPLTYSLTAAQSSVQNNGPVFDIEQLHCTDPEPVCPDYGSASILPSVPSSFTSHDSDSSFSGDSTTGYSKVREEPIRDSLSLATVSSDVDLSNDGLPSKVDCQQLERLPSQDDVEDVGSGSTPTEIQKKVLPDSESSDFLLPSDDPEELYDDPGSSFQIESGNYRFAAYASAFDKFAKELSGRAAPILDSSSGFC